MGEHLDLSAATISLVLNRSPRADSIPPATQERIFAAAAELGYRPNFLARSLRSQRSSSIGVLLPEISEGYAAGVMTGIEDCLLNEGYFYLVASHRSASKRLSNYLELLEERRVEGFLLVNTPLESPPRLPAVAISGHRELPGVTNVVVDHDAAAVQALTHLAELGHRQIAFFKGHPNTADSEDRWRAIEEAAHGLGLTIRPELTLQFGVYPAGRQFKPEEGYEEGSAFGRLLIERGHPFTALFAFNDISAIGAMRAFLDHGLRVPEDVSVIGFDDIQSAGFQNPRLTTVRQPLREMGRIAARALLERLDREIEPRPFLTVKPRLIVRESTGPVPGRPKPSKH